MGIEYFDNSVPTISYQFVINFDCEKPFFSKLFCVKLFKKLEALLKPLLTLFDFDIAGNFSPRKFCIIPKLFFELKRILMSITRSELPKKYLKLAYDN